MRSDPVIIGYQYWNRSGCVKEDNSFHSPLASIENKMWLNNPTIWWQQLYKQLDTATSHPLKDLTFNSQSNGGHFDRALTTELFIWRKFTFICIYVYVYNGPENICILASLKKFWMSSHYKPKPRTKWHL